MTRAPPQSRPRAGHLSRWPWAAAIRPRRRRRVDRPRRRHRRPGRRHPGRRAAHRDGDRRPPPAGRRPAVRSTPGGRSRSWPPTRWPAGCPARRAWPWPATPWPSTSHRLGLRPVPGRAGGFQPFTMRLSTTLDPDRPASRSNGKPLVGRPRLRPRRASAARGRFAAAGGRLRRVRHHAPRQRPGDYDDYAGLDVRGRVVLAMMKEPLDGPPPAAASPPAGQTWSDAAHFNPKAADGRGPRGDGPAAGGPAEQRRAGRRPAVLPRGRRQRHRRPARRAGQPPRRRPAADHRQPARPDGAAGPHRRRLRPPVGRPWPTST